MNTLSKTLITLAIAGLYATGVYATSISLTPAQIDKVVRENAPTECVDDPVTPITPPVDPPVVPIDPIPSHCGTSLLNGEIVEWSSVFNGIQFPNPISLQQFVTIPRKGYLAVKFNTKNFNDTGTIATIESTSSNGRRLGSISECPGDFDVAYKCRKYWGTGGDIFWSTEGYSKACILDPNTTYYFNVTFTNGVNPTSTECTSNLCITKLKIYNPQ